MADETTNSYYAHVKMGVKRTKTSTDHSNRQIGDPVVKDAVIGEFTVHANTAAGLILRVKQHADLIEDDDE